MLKKNGVKEISVEEALSMCGSSWNNIENKYSQSREEYLTYQDLKDAINNRLSKSILKDSKLVKKFQKEKNRTYYNKKDALILADIKEIIDENFAPMTTALKEHLIFQNTPQINQNNGKLYERLKRISDAGLFHMYLISDIKKERILVYLPQLEEFMEEYISVYNANKKYGTKDNYIRMKTSLPFITISRAQKGQFINKKKLENEMLKRSYGKSRTYSIYEVMEKLGLSKVLAKRVLSQYEVKDFNLRYLKSDITKLMNEQENLIREFKRHYYTRKETAEKLETDYFPTNLRKRLKGIIPPDIVRRSGDKFSTSEIIVKEHIYDKQLVDSEAHKRKLSVLIRSDPTTAPYERFLNVLSFKGVEFSEKGKDTERAFHKFIERKLKSSNASENQISSYIQKFSQVAELLAELTVKKELYEYTENELNIRVFNDKTKKALRFGLLTFMNMWAESASKQGEQLWNLNQIRKPKHNRAEKKIYSVEEYIEISEYTKMVQKHVRNALSDSELFGKKEYSRYDSAWLYVLLHLTNLWRSKDVMELQRISLKGTSLEEKSLKWLENNLLEKEDIEVIIAQLYSRKFNHYKNKRRRYFFSAEELKEPFAYALAICELRCQQYTPHAEYLIDMKGSYRVLETSLKKFFSEICLTDFVFKSLQMNRTVFSYIFSVINKKTNRNPLEVDKVLRNHSSEEMNNIYINISQRELDYLTSHLFNLGKFGYVYTLMKDILNNKEEDNYYESESKSLEIKDTFGDFMTIETISKYITNLEAKNFEKQAVKDYLLGWSKQELQDTFNSVEMGLTPAKEENVYCVFQECKLPERQCSKCQFSIHSFVSLSLIGNRLKENLHTFNQRFENSKTDGEKSFLVNNLSDDIELIKMATEKFGDRIVSEFIIDSNLDELREETKKIGNHSSYLTKGENKNEKQ